ncbi:hypothetical protein RJ639_010006 [Escallonia herrerae]|uniref:CCHC-type domain-containing protein n=1 Tax=Escallonia herrerae TaxID=1293975 RepID=A0AA88VUY0_9ASTE|nr:hypothetical protein RJ639_010006 [Escallonia herrerae]
MDAMENDEQFGIWNLTIMLCYMDRSLSMKELYRPWADALEAAIAAVSKYGGARAGYRTLLDALIPASSVLKERLTAGDDPADAFVFASEAALAGAESTKLMQAQAGRATYISGEILASVPDPGAVAAASWFRAAALVTSQYDQAISLPRSLVCISEATCLASPLNASSCIGGRENRREEHGEGLLTRSRSTDHAGSKNNRRLRSQSKASKLKCYYCHNEWHYKKDCPERKGKKKDNSKTADAGVVEDNSDGSILIRMHDGTVRTLTDVRHIPELRENLIALGMLDSNSCSYRAAGGVMRIMKGALVVMKRLKQNSLYLLQGSTVTGAAATTSFSDIDFDTIKLWHMHLGHMTERGMDVLSKQGYANGVKGYRLWCPDSESSKKRELIDAGKDHGAREKVELEFRALDSLPIIPTDKDYGSHSTE